MDKIAEFIVGLFRDLKLPFRWGAIGLILVLIIFGFWGFERLTGQFYFSRLERKITLLSELQKIKDSGIEQNPELYTIYKDMVKDLESFSVKQPSVVEVEPINISDPNTIGKAISGAFLWILVLVIGVSSEIKKAKKITGMTVTITVFLLLAILLFAWIGMIIPTIINPWFNYIVFPIVQVVILVMLTRKSSKPTAVSPSQQA